MELRVTINDQVLIETLNEYMEESRLTMEAVLETSLRRLLRRELRKKEDAQ